MIRELRAGVPNLFGAAQLYARPGSAGTVELAATRYGIAQEPAQYKPGDRVIVDDEPWTLKEILDTTETDAEHPAAYPLVARLEHQEEAQ